MNTPPTGADRRRDEQHLNLLAIFHYVYGGLTLLSGCFVLVYFGVIFALLSSPEVMEDEEVPAGVVAGVMAVVGGCALLLTVGIGALVIYSGIGLAKHQNYVLSMVVAAIMCLSIPLGTILGIFTIVVLMRPSVKDLFDEAKRSLPPA